MSEEVKTSMGMTFRAFNVPNFATMCLPPSNRGEGMQKLPTLPIAALDGAALDALAAQWLDHLYASVGRASPFTKEP